MDDQNNQTAEAEAAAREAAAQAQAEAQAAAAAAQAQAEKAPKQRATTRVRRQAITTVTNPMTAVSSVQETIQETDLAELPASIKLAAPYAFYDDDGVLHSWAAGQVVSDPSEVATLIERGALVEE